MFVLLHLSMNMSMCFQDKKVVYLIWITEHGLPTSNEWPKRSRLKIPHCFWDMNKGYDMFKCQSLYKLKTKRKVRHKRIALNISIENSMAHPSTPSLDFPSPSNAQMPVAVQLFIPSSSKFFLVMILLILSIFRLIFFQISFICCSV